jgi:class 3 adenylate cyclase
MRPKLAQVSTLTCATAALLISTGCTLKATLNEITDTTSNITGTTSGRTWWNEDGLLNPEHKAIAFATYNEANLEQDLARGQGEYLASLGSLLGVDQEAQPAFQAAAQDRFTRLRTADQQTRLEQLLGLAR